MKDKDLLQPFMFEHAPIRGGFARLEQSLKTIIDQHQYPDVLRQILGEMLVAISLLCANIKFKGRVTLQFQGKEKLKLLLVQCNHDFHLRGLAQWDGEFDQTELEQLLKQGLLAIIMEPAAVGAKRYQGVVAWSGNSLAESLEGYFRNSEQLPTRLWLAVNEAGAAGLLLQMMPGEATQLGIPLFENDDWERITCVTSTLTPHELLNLSNEKLLYRLYSEDEIRLFESIPLCFCCECSVERSENALRFLGEEEARQELNEHQKIVITCDFCSREFIFDRVDVARIFKSGSSDSSDQIH